jgi:hypothetical protein
MSLHDTQPKHSWVKMQDKSTCYHEHFYPARLSTTHKLDATSHPNRIGNPRSK